jgi:RNA polymerase sigma-70 factor (ECF subfamily)
VKLPPLEQLYLSHGPAVLRRARRILDNDADAQEVLQDVFTTLIQKPHQYRGQSSVMTFLYGMTTHAALTKLRNQRTQRRLLDAQVDVRMQAPLGQARVELREALATLPAELATVAVYHYLDEMTQDEIAGVMGCSRQWVTKLVARLRERPLADNGGGVLIATEVAGRTAGEL